jgi:hypothetical protein
VRFVWDLVELLLGLIRHGELYLRIIFSIKLMRLSSVFSAHSKYTDIYIYIYVYTLEGRIHVPYYPLFENKGRDIPRARRSASQGGSTPGADSVLL